MDENQQQPITSNNIPIEPMPEDKSKVHSLLGEIRKENRLKILTRTGVSLLVVVALIAPVFFTSIPIADNKIDRLPETGEEENSPLLRFTQHELALKYPRSQWLISDQDSNSAILVLIPNQLDTSLPTVDVEVHLVDRDYTFEELRSLQGGYINIVTNSDSLSFIEGDERFTTLHYDFAVLKFSSNGDIYTNYLAQIPQRELLLELTILEPEGNIAYQTEITKLLESMQPSLLELPQTGTNDELTEAKQVRRNRVIYSLLITSLAAFAILLLTFAAYSSIKSKPKVETPDILKPKLS